MARFTFLLVTLLLAAACGSETVPDTGTVAATDTTRAPAPSDVCAMMTVDELKTAAGLEQASGMSSTSGGAKVCTWTGENGKVVVVQVFPSATSFEQARTAFESQYGGTAETIVDVGDRAYFISGSTGPLQTGTLVAQKGSTPISVQVMSGSGDPATSRGEATAVAHVILGKL